MKDRILFADLDGTLIFSAKKKKAGDVVVERKNGEEISCVSAYAAGLFGEFKNVVPVTTRSVEQYKRIDFPQNFSPKFALVDNGGNLLIDGEISAEWRVGLDISGYERELSLCREALENDIFRTFETRFVDDIFLFTKSREPAKTLKLIENFSGLSSFFVGEKVYSFPEIIDKGSAARRLCETFHLTSEIYCAGDSFPDISLLDFADVAVFPDDLRGVSCGDTRVFLRENFCDIVAEFAAGRRI